MAINTIDELKEVLSKMMDDSEEYCACAKGAYDEGYEEGYYQALVDVFNKI